MTFKKKTLFQVNKVRPVFRRTQISCHTLRVLYKGGVFFRYTATERAVVFHVNFFLGAESGEKEGVVIEDIVAAKGTGTCKLKRAPFLQRVKLA